jgi:hypothetical protein
MATTLVARKADRRTETEELRMEIRAAGQDMVSIGQRIYALLVGGHYKAVEHEVGRLVTLGSAYAEMA